MLSANYGDEEQFRSSIFSSNSGSSEEVTLAFARRRLVEMGVTFSHMEPKSDDLELAHIEQILRISLLRTGYNHSYDGYGIYHDSYGRSGMLMLPSSKKRERIQEALILTIINVISDPALDFIQIPVDSSIRAKMDSLPAFLELHLGAITTQHGCYDILKIDKKSYSDEEEFFEAQEKILSKLGSLGALPDIDSQLDIAATFSKKQKNLLFEKLISSTAVNQTLPPKIPSMEKIQKERINLLQTLKKATKAHRHFSQRFYSKLLSRLIENLELPKEQQSVARYKSLMFAWNRLIDLANQAIICVYNNKDFLQYIEFAFDEAILINVLSENYSYLEMLKSFSDFEQKNYDINDRMQSFFHTKIAGSAMRLLSDMTGIFLANPGENFSALLQSKVYYEMTEIFHNALNIKEENDSEATSDIQVYTVKNKQPILKKYSIQKNGYLNRSISEEIDVMFCGFRENVSSYSYDDAKKSSAYQKKFQTCDIFFLIGEQLHLRRNFKKSANSKKIVVVIDDTIGANKELAEIVKWYQKEIVNGDLAILAIRSLNKYFHIGMDKLPAGIITGIFNDLHFPILKTYFNNINISAINLTYPMIAFQMKYCSDLVEIYLNKIEANSIFLHDKIITPTVINQSYQKSIAIFSPYTATVPRHVSGFLIMQVNDEDIVFDLTEVFLKNNINSRDGYGFSVSTSAFVPFDTCTIFRISVGIESENLLREKFNPILIWISYINLLMSLLTLEIEAREILADDKENFLAQLAYDESFYLKREQIYLLRDEIYFGEQGRKILRKSESENSESENSEFEISESESSESESSESENSEFTDSELADIYYSFATRWETGEQLEKNKAMAFQFYARAAQFGHADALYRLGCLAMDYYQICPIERDFKTAKNAFYLAQCQGHCKAAEKYKKYFAPSSASVVSLSLFSSSFPISRLASQRNFPVSCFQVGAPSINNR